MKEINAVGVAIIDTQNRVLIAQRPKEKTMPDKWEFPGGKIEAGETPELCIVREIKEELAVDIETHQYLGNEVFPYEEYKVTLHLFTGHIIGNQTMTLHEHQAIAWVHVDELENYDFPAVDLPFIQKLKTILG